MSVDDERLTRRALSEIRVCGNDLILFTESPDHIDALLRDISAAKSRVWLESYIISDDEVGKTSIESPGRFDGGYDRPTL